MSAPGLPPHERGHRDELSLHGAFIPGWWFAMIFDATPHRSPAADSDVPGVAVYFPGDQWSMVHTTRIVRGEQFACWLEARVRREPWRPRRWKKRQRRRALQVREAFAVQLLSMKSP